MTAERYLRVEKGDGLAEITIDRPETLNAIDLEILEGLDRTFAVLQEDAAIRVIILTGAGEKAFVSGGDIRAMLALTVEEGKRFVARGQDVLSRIERGGAVVIAAVNGYCLGGGLEIALACDIRIASERAQFGFPEVGVGLIPGWGGTQRLARLVGKGRAKEMTLTGRRVGAEEGWRMGIVSVVVPPDRLLTACREMAGQILANSPIAVEQAKKALNEGPEASLAQGLALEAEAWLVNFATADRQEGLRAFLEKRKPRFGGR